MNSKLKLQTTLSGRCLARYHPAVEAQIQLQSPKRIMQQQAGYYCLKLIYQTCFFMFWVCMEPSAPGKQLYCLLEVLLENTVTFCYFLLPWWYITRQGEQNLKCHCMKKSSSPLSSYLPYLWNFHSLAMHRKTYLSIHRYFKCYFCIVLLSLWASVTELKGAISSLTAELQPLFRISLPETLRHLLVQRIQNFTNVIKVIQIVPKQHTLSSFG